MVYVIAQSGSGMKPIAHQGFALIFILIVMSIVACLALKLGIQSGTLSDFVHARVRLEQQMWLAQAMLYYTVAFCNEHKHDLITQTIYEPIELHIGPYELLHDRYDGKVTMVQEGVKYRLKVLLTMNDELRHVAQCLMSFNSSQLNQTSYTIEEWCLIAK